MALAYVLLLHHYLVIPAAALLLPAANHRRKIATIYFNYEIMHSAIVALPFLSAQSRVLMTPGTCSETQRKNKTIELNTIDVVPSD